MILCACCGTQLFDVDMACPVCLPNFYINQRGGFATMQRKPLEPAARPAGRVELGSGVASGPYSSQRRTEDSGKL